MEPVISLSTCCLRKHKDGYEMLAKAVELGFKHVELGHGTVVSQVDGIERAVAEGIVKVSSLHNFCPVPPFAPAPAPNLYSPATKSKSETAQWKRHTLNTLAFAETVKASRVVMHSGELIYFWGSPKFAMQKLYGELRAVEKSLAEFDAEKDEDKTALEKDVKIARKNYENALPRFIAKAQKRAEKAHDIVFENVQSVHEDFAQKNILLGLENRDGWCELPFDTMFADFAERLNTLSHARGWIDIGHAQVKALRGVFKLEDFLESLRGKICAWHLHDTTAEGRDHNPIGKGVTDFNLVKKFFEPQNHNFILELSPSVTEEEIIDSRKRLEDMF